MVEEEAMMVVMVVMALVKKESLETTLKKDGKTWRRRHCRK